MGGKLTSMGSTVAADTPQGLETTMCKSKALLNKPEFVVCSHEDSVKVQVNELGTLLWV